MMNIKKNLRVLVLTRYSNLGSSSRLRFYQYLDGLNKTNITTVVAPFFNDEYVQQLYFGKISYWNVLVCYIKRIAVLMYSNEFDVFWVEKEVFPWIPMALERFCLSSKVKVIVDYDDAVYHRYENHKYFIVRQFLGMKIASVMKNADLVVAGNSYIAQYASAANAKKVQIIPTVIDDKKYAVAAGDIISDIVTVGWIGAPSTAKFLSEIASALKIVYQSKKVRFLFIGLKENPVSEVSVNLVDWYESTEIDCLSEIDIGIMPLSNEPFEKGKCGYKLIQYMACGKPVIASPVGVNNEIVEHGINGFLASTPTEWVEYLSILIEDSVLRKTMGDFGRKKVIANYCLTRSLTLYVNVFNNLFSLD